MTDLPDGWHHGPASGDWGLFKAGRIVALARRRRKDGWRWVVAYRKSFEAGSPASHGRADSFEQAQARVLDGLRARANIEPDPVTRGALELAFTG